MCVSGTVVGLEMNCVLVRYCRRTGGELCVLVRYCCRTGGELCVGQVLL